MNRTRDLPLPMPLALKTLPAVATAILAAPATAQAATTAIVAPFDSGSPAYAAVRWLWFLATLTTIGAVAFRYLVTGFARELDPDTRKAAVHRAASIGLASAAFALAADALRLVAQAVALLGGIGPDVMVLITGTTWGSAWLIGVAAATAALAAFAIAARNLPGGWPLAALTIPALSAAPALSGHAAAQSALQPLPILADSLHVAAAGGWIGGLLVLLTAGLPATRRATSTWRQTATLVAAFSPVALTCAALILATGLFASVSHLHTPAQLITSDWGRLLSLKIGAAIVTAVFGALNFLRFRRRLDRLSGEHDLRRSATAELIAGAILLLITAVLVATDPPASTESAPPASVIRSD